MNSRWLSIEILNSTSPHISRILENSVYILTAQQFAICLMRNKIMGWWNADRIVKYSHHPIFIASSFCRRANCKRCYGYVSPGWTWYQPNSLVPGMYSPAENLSENSKKRANFDGLFFINSIVFARFETWGTNPRNSLDSSEHQCGSLWISYLGCWRPDPRYISDNFERRLWSDPSLRWLLSKLDRKKQLVCPTRYE